MFTMGFNHWGPRALVTGKLESETWFTLENSDQPDYIQRKREAGWLDVILADISGRTTVDYSPTCICAVDLNTIVTQDTTTSITFLQLSSAEPSFQTDGYPTMKNNICLSWPCRLI